MAPWYLFYTKWQTLLTTSVQDKLTKFIKGLTRNIKTAKFHHIQLFLAHTDSSVVDCLWIQSSYDILTSASCIRDVLFH